MNLAQFWQLLGRPFEPPLVLKAVLTVFGIVFLILVFYAEKIFNPDEDGDYVPGPKYLFYLWFSFFLLAMWANAPFGAYFIGAAALAIASRVQEFLAGSTS